MSIPEARKEVVEQVAPRPFSLSRPTNERRVSCKRVAAVADGCGKRWRSGLENESRHFDGAI